MKAGRLRAGFTPGLALRRLRVRQTRPGVGIVRLDAGADAVNGLARVAEPWAQEKGLEAAAGVEPAMEVLQTSALPLGYAAPAKGSGAGEGTRTLDLLHGKQTL